MTDDEKKRWLWRYRGSLEKEKALRADLQEQESRGVMTTAALTGMPGGGGDGQTLARAVESIVEAQQKLQEQAGRLESAFMNDFVAEIDENVREAKREMDAINRELRHMPFGNDTYKFVMKEKPDRALFFRICRRLEKYMSSPQVYMNSARDDEEMENDIQEFMSIILAEEDEWEYTD